MFPIELKYVKYQTNLPLKSQGVVVHETADPGDTCADEWAYTNNNNIDVYAHLYTDTKSTVQFCPLDMAAYHAMSPANEMFIGWEMCHALNGADFNVIYENTCEGIADYLRSIGSVKVTADNVMSHNEVSNRWHNSDHTDPTDYLAAYGKNISLMRQRIQAYIDEKTVPGSGATMNTAPSVITLAAPAPTFVQIVKLGSINAGVSAIQTRLNALGFPCGAVDGNFGQKTLGAVTAFQRANQLRPDGVVGPLTWAALYKNVTMPAIVCKGIRVLGRPGCVLKQLPNSISGGFNSGGEPWSIGVSEGKVIHGVSCHALLGYPESVLYELADGTFGILRTSNADKLPSGVITAVGGMGLLENFDPGAEGFKQLGNQDFSDVLRLTDHTMIGVKDNLWHLVFCKAMTGYQVNAFAKAQGFELAVMLDGGPVAAINGGVPTAQINIDAIEYYVLQGK